MTERWLPVVGYEGFYEVSDQGNVRRVMATAGAQVGRVLKATPSKKGYLRVTLHRDGERKDYWVHRLVLLAFVGPCPAGMEACHAPDPDPANNRLVNLRWDTSGGNKLDSVAHGSHYEASKTHCPRRHPLRGVNLVPSTLIRGGRDCLACNRARKYASYHGLELTQEITDRYYNALISEEEA